MRNATAAAGIAAIGLLAAGAPGAAGAETPPAPAPIPPQRTVSVEGVAGVPVASEASAEAANAAYRQAMAAAIADGQGKAQFLAEKSGAALGAVQSVAEGGGYIQCPGELEYRGAQPDFGQGAPIVSAGRALAAPRAVVHARRVSPKHRRRRRARGAAAQTCTLSTQVALVYALS